MDKITEVETTLSPYEFMLFLRHIAKTEVPDLYFKEVSDFPYMEKPTIGRLTFGIPGYQGHLWIRETGEGEEGAKKMVLFLDHRSRFLPKEVKEDIKKLVFEVLNLMAKRTPNYLVSFTTI